MSRCVSSITLHRTITKYFKKLNQRLDEAIEQANGIALLLENITHDFEKDHGIANFRVRRLRLEKYKYEVTRLEQKYSHLKNTRTLFFREQMSITNRFYDSVCTASRKIYGMALRDANHWNNNLMVPMETYVREHHTQLRRRLESVKRIHRASDTVDTRLEELRDMQTELQAQHALFQHHRQHLDKLLADIKPAASTDLSESAEIVYLGSKKSFSY